jgi:hypothetical protein
MTLGDKIMEDSWNKGKDVVQELAPCGLQNDKQTQPKNWLNLTKKW